MKSLLVFTAIVTCFNFITTDSNCMESNNTRFYKIKTRQQQIKHNRFSNNEDDNYSTSSESRKSNDMPFIDNNEDPAPSYFDMPIYEKEYKKFRSNHKIANKINDDDATQLSNAANYTYNNTEYNDDIDMEAPIDAYSNNAAPLSSNKNNKQSIRRMYKDKLKHNNITYNY